MRDSGRLVTARPLALGCGNLIKAAAVENASQEVDAGRVFLSAPERL